MARTRYSIYEVVRVDGMHVIIDKSRPPKGKGAVPVDRFGRILITNSPQEAEREAARLNKLPREQRAWTEE